MASNLRKTAFPDMFPEMNQPRKTPVQTYRQRLAERKLRRVEVVVPEDDAQRIRALAREFSENGPEAERLRRELAKVTANSPKGGLLRLLLASPLAGADIKFVRDRHPGREVDL
ncbi:MAG: hypothetical protein NWR47_05715 [Aestuariivirgaceae bacterium]|nr:hypothetical protein [Aestuariivirgaceae bacterium]